MKTHKNLRINFRLNHGCPLMKSKKRKVHQKMQKKAKTKAKKSGKNGNVCFC